MDVPKSERDKAIKDDNGVINIYYDVIGGFILIVMTSTMVNKQGDIAKSKGFSTHTIEHVPTLEFDRMCYLKG